MNIFVLLNNQTIALEQYDESGTNQYILRKVLKTEQGYVLHALNPEFEDIPANESIKPLARLRGVVAD